MRKRKNIRNNDVVFARFIENLNIRKSQLVDVLKTSSPYSRLHPYVYTREHIVFGERTLETDWVLVKFNQKIFAPEPRNHVDILPFLRMEGFGS